MYIVIAGKTNVGKSTLFNRMCQRKLATTGAKAGITRDYKEYSVNINDTTQCTLIDTAGWEDNLMHNIDNQAIPLHYNASTTNNEEMKCLMVSKTMSAITKADLILFVVDGKNGLTHLDHDLTQLIRKFNKRTIALINKAESACNISDQELRRLNFDSRIFISAQHGTGMHELYDAIAQYHHHNDDTDTHAETLANESQQHIINLAIVGRPNAGKSTLFNHILQEDRSIVSNAAGTTRDCIEKSIQHSDDTQIRFIDTAGIRKRNKIQGHTENIALSQSITAIRRSHVTILLMDIQNAFEKQDMSIAKIAINEGKPIILAMNKTDIISPTQEKTFRKHASDFLRNNFTDIYNISVIYISSINGSNVNRLVNKAVELYHSSGTTIKTTLLNKWIQQATAKHSLPLSSNKKRIKIKYAVQKASRPITLMLFLNITENIPQSYKRYLISSFCEHFKIHSSPIRIIFNKNHNPYSLNRNN